jgi:hypothetical protein
MSAATCVASLADPAASAGFVAADEPLDEVVGDVVDDEPLHAARTIMMSATTGLMSRAYHVGSYSVKPDGSLEALISALRAAARARCTR